MVKFLVKGEKSIYYRLEKVCSDMREKKGDMMVDNIVLFLMQVNGISRRTIYKNFQLATGEYSIEDIQDIIKQAALNAKKINVPSIKELEATYDRYRAIIDRSNELGIRIYSYLDQKFPTKLRKIADPPAVVYVLGNSNFPH